MASTIVQLFLKQVLESYFHSRIQVRIAAVNVIHLILKQGLIHPVPVSNSCSVRPANLTRSRSTDCITV